MRSIGCSSASTLCIRGKSIRNMKESRRKSMNSHLRFSILLMPDGMLPLMSIEEKKYAIIGQFNVRISSRNLAKECLYQLTCRWDQSLQAKPAPQSLHWAFLTMHYCPALNGPAYWYHCCMWCRSNHKHQEIDHPSRNFWSTLNLWLRKRWERMYHILCFNLTQLPLTGVEELLQCILFRREKYWVIFEIKT